MKYEKMTKAQLIQEIEKVKKEAPNVVVSNNVMTSTANVVWDETSLEAVINVSKGLLNLTELFIQQKIELAGIKIENSK